jgi:two-component sensor histidine kinase
LLIAELDHRVKNVVSCVAAIVQRTRESSGSMVEFTDALKRRIHSMANTYAPVEPRPLAGRQPRA